MTSYAYDAMRDQVDGPDPRTLEQADHMRDGRAVPVSKIMEVCKIRRERARQDRRQYEGVWRLCQAFLSGNQWVALTKGRDQRVVELKNPRKRERHTVDLLTQFLYAALGKVYDDNAMPDMLFAQPDAQTQAFVQQSKHAFRYLWDDEVAAQEVLMDILLETCAIGTCGVEVVCNHNRGDYYGEVPVDDQGQIIPIDEANPAYQQVMEKMMYGEEVDWRVMREGRIEWQVLSWVNLLPPPGVWDPSRFPWIIVEQPVPLDEAKQMYGARAANLKEQQLSQVDVVGSDPGAVSDTDGAGSSGRLRDHVLISTMHELPTRDFPHGRQVVWSQDTFLAERPRLKYVVAGEPKAGIVFFRYHRVPRRFWGKGVVQAGIGPQRQRNRARSQHIEMKDKNLGRVYAKKGTLTEANTPVGKIMELIDVKQSVNLRNDILETQGVPPGGWITDEKTMNDEDMEKAMGLRDVVNSESMKGVTAYAAFALQAQQEDQRVGVILSGIRQSILQCAELSYQAMRRYWPADKQVVIAGQQNEAQAFMFNASKLPAHVYFYWGHGASTPKNPAANVQKIFDIYDRSVASGRPLGMEWLMGSLDAGEPLPFPANVQELQRQKAELENMLAAQGTPPVVSPLDDHATHIPEHELAMQQAVLAQRVDVAQILFEHIQQHSQAMQAQQQLVTSVPGMQGGMGALGGPQEQAANMAAGQTPQLMQAGVQPPA